MTRTPNYAFSVVAAPAVLFASVYWIVVLAMLHFAPYQSSPKPALLLIVIGIPDALATWWIFHTIGTRRSRQDAWRAATAFAASAPLALAVSNLFGFLVGSYAESLLGRFILPAIAVFTLIVMISVTGGVVMWALHPSGGITTVDESEQNEHR